MYAIGGMPKNSPRKPTSVREPVQVYLGQDDRDLLNRLVAETGLALAVDEHFELAGFERVP